MKIICIGMNYTEHIKEFGGQIPTAPLFFMKPETALLRNNDPFYIPDFSDDVHYECEVVIRINRITKAIDEKFAYRCYDQIGLGIDFTARDLQRRCRESGEPWEICKAFDNSAAVSDQFIKKDELGQVLNFTLDVNGEQRQSGSSDDMIFSIDRIISHVSKYITLKTGDLIFTGTPSGVGAVKIGDRLVAQLNGRTMMDFEIK